MSQQLTAKFLSSTKLVLIVFLVQLSCKKTSTETTTSKKPKADFSFTIKNQGELPDTVNFASTSTNATSVSWYFDNGNTSTLTNPQAVYTSVGTYNVKLIASNQYGSDSITKQVLISLYKPTPNFIYTIHNQGFLPDTVDFVSTTPNATSIRWYFGDGKTDTAITARNIYTTHGTFNVKLVATNAAGSDSITKSVNVLLNKPVAGFNFTLSNPEVLPITLTTANTTKGSGISYTWSFGNGTSIEANPTHNFTTGGIYNIKLLATNASGSDSVTKQIRISPYPQVYTSFNSTPINLYAWEGSKVMILSRNNNLNRTTMYKWVKAMDNAYNYYKLCTGKEPVSYEPTYINNRTTIADAAVTCGAACGYLGFTGIEIQNNYFDIVYNRIHSSNSFEHFPFYEFGRNFWFYGDKLAYKANDPVTTGYAVFMGFMAMKAAGVNGNSSSVQEKVIDTYLANAAYNWSNTLALGQSIPGTNTSGPDLFASFCFRLRRDYGGDAFVEKLWKLAGQRPNAATTQDAVDNFFLASCAAANKNLTTLFTTWRWPLSASAITAASQYP